MKFATLIALVACANALTIRKVNPNGGNFKLDGTPVPPPPPPVASSESKPYEGSAVDNSQSGREQHQSSINDQNVLKHMNDHANRVWKVASESKVGDKPNYHVEPEKIEGITEIYKNGRRNFV